MGLINYLSEIYIDENSIIRLLKQADINLNNINLNTSSLNIWNDVIQQAKEQNKLNDLFLEIQKDYPDNITLFNEFFKYLSKNKITKESKTMDNLDFRDLEKQINEMNIRFSTTINKLELKLEILNKSLQELNNFVKDLPKSNHTTSITGGQITIISILMILLISFLIYLLANGASIL